MPAINPQRLLNDLRQLRTFGAHGNGVVRLALSPIDIESRRWLVGRLTEAGLEARIDGIGTVFGRSPGKGRALLIGSHTDTQPTGGWLDGAMGVIYGLEIARALRESPETRDLAVDVASWIDEEGTFAGFIGSRSFCGEPVAEVVARARNREGQPMSDALQAAGIAGQPLARMEPGRYVAYLEPHIEQGGRLEAAGKRIGVVTSIVGIWQYRITFSGEQNHAGTTRMARDPRHGVVDPDGRVHGTRNLFVCGASVFPTAGFANPTLTIVALALRLADHLVPRPLAGLAPPGVDRGVEQRS